ncbi:MAG: Isoniazid-inducible protein iniA [Actinomycetota bacterium]|nr:Isoniazid-inducible protein iniA [Actinomycetota bacterium]
MSVTMQSAELMTSAELISLLDQANRLAGAVGRPDPIERLARAHARIAARRMRVVVVGSPGQGATSLVQVLERASADRLPGARFVDAAGLTGSNKPVVPEPGSADVVLFVSDAGHEYSPAELDALARIRAQGTALVGVLTKIDLYPRWAEVQRANRSRLQAANLDSPTIPLLPVSSAMCDSGRQRGDDSLSVASGVPQLLEFLRDRIGTRVDPALRDGVLGEVRVVTDQLGKIWNSELDALQAGGDSPPQRQQRAGAELDLRQQLSAQWQLALGDGATELMAQVDFDLRDRLREVMELAEEQITTTNPMRHWRPFDKWVRGKVEDSVQANFQLAAQRAQQLAEQVAAKLAGNHDGSHTGVALPQVPVAGAGEALRRVKPMEPPNSGGAFARVVNSVRGSYGGILMVGVLTSLAGLALISVWSVVAGVLLGLFTFWEDRKNGHERGKAEAKMAVSKLMDNVNFRVGDELRSQLRAVHRALRDHFAEINDQRLRTAADAVRAAHDPALPNGGQRDARLSQLHNYLTELRQLRIRATAPTADRSHPTAQRGNVVYV